MRKKYNHILIIGLTVIKLISFGFALAQTTRLEELQAQAEKRAKDAHEKIQELYRMTEGQTQRDQQAFVQRVGFIKDRSKRMRAERIMMQFRSINTVWADHFTEVLDHLDAVLQKIQSRKEKIEAAGADVADGTIAIAEAEASISAARAAVVGQVQKAYVVSSQTDEGDVQTTEIVDEKTLLATTQNQLKQLRNQLFLDLISLRDGAMKDARDDVRAAFQALLAIEMKTF